MSSFQCQRSQYVEHALHCDFDSTSTISHSSVFPTSWIISLILRWRDWTHDVDEEHFEVLVVEGDSRSAESSCERYYHVIVSPSRSARPRCWSQCYPHRLKSWTCSRLMMQYHGVRENQILALCVCASFHGFPRSIRRTKFFLQTFTNNLLWVGLFLHQKHVPYPRVSPFDHRLDWVWIGLFWKIQHEALLQKTVERVFQLADAQL